MVCVIGSRQVELGEHSVFISFETVQYGKPWSQGLTTYPWNSGGGSAVLFTSSFLIAFLTLLSPIAQHCDIFWKINMRNTGELEFLLTNPGDVLEHTVGHGPLPENQPRNRLREENVRSRDFSPLELQEWVRFMFAVIPVQTAGGHPRTTMEYAGSKLPVSSPLRSPLWEAVIPPALTKTGCSLPSILEGLCKNKKIVGLERLQFLTPSLFILFPSLLPPSHQWYKHEPELEDLSPKIQISPHLLGLLSARLNAHQSSVWAYTAMHPLAQSVTSPFLCFVQQYNTTPQNPRKNARKYQGDIKT